MHFIIENSPIYDLLSVPTGSCEAISCSAFGSCRANCGSIKCAIITCGTMMFDD